MKILSTSDNGLVIRNSSPTEAEIIIYAGIGQDYWGDGSMISAKQFSDALKKIGDTVKNINVRISSGGGDVFEGVAIYNRLKQHKAKKTVYIDGLAASIASIIALAGDEIIMGEGAMYMIHLPWTFAIGNRTDLDNTVNRLLDVEEQMLGIYARKTGLDRSEIRAMLEAETWFDAKEAIEKGFVDSQMEETMPIAASMINAKWISKKPKGYFSETKAAQTKITEMKNKIQERLARK